MTYRSKSGVWLAAAMLLLACFNLCLPGQHEILAKGTPPAALSAQAKGDIVKKVGELLAQYYIFPEKGAAMQRHLEKQLKAGKFATISEPLDLAHSLTAEVRGVMGDSHLRVIYDPLQVQRKRARESMGEEARRQEQQRRLDQERGNNFGFRRLEILPGNVGYLELTGFSGSREAGETIVAAMNFLANADAVIIDLRKNGGGSALTIKVICSYFFGEAVHLTSWEWRGREGQQQSWSLPWVPGRSMAETDLYVLTGRGTFSAAEEFCDDLKNLKRATLVGEKTGGGAHPGGTRIVSDDFLVWVPTGRAVNPVSKSNWEGVGIAPDVAVAEGLALDKAHGLALEKIAGRTKDAEKAARIKWAREDLQARVDPAQVAPEILQRYVGRYEGSEVAMTEGRLVARIEGRTLPMTPLSETYFHVGDAGMNARVEFVADASGKTFDAVLYRPGGRSQNMKRSAQ